MSTEETLRAEAEARRALAGRHDSGRHADAIATYLAAYDYSERRREEDGEKEPERGKPER